MKKMILLFMLLGALPSLAQNKVRDQDTRVWFGNVEVTAKPDAVITTAQILSSPKLVYTSPDYKVFNFSIVFQQDGRDVFGPYFTQGASLTDEEIRVLRKLAGRHFKISIEDIKVIGSDNTVRNMGSLFLTCDN